MGSAVDKFMNFMKLDNKDEENEDYGFADDDVSSSDYQSSENDEIEKPRKTAKGMFKTQETRRKNMGAGYCSRLRRHGGKIWAQVIVQVSA